MADLLAQGAQRWGMAQEGIGGMHRGLRGMLCHSVQPGSVRQDARVAPLLPRGTTCGATIIDASEARAKGDLVSIQGVMHFVSHGMAFATALARHDGHLVCHGCRYQGSDMG